MSLGSREIVYYFVHRELDSKHQYFLLDTDYNVMLENIRNGNINYNYGLAFDFFEELKLPIKPIYPGYEDCNVVLIDLPKVNKDEPLSLDKVKKKVEQYKLKQKKKENYAKLKKLEADFN